MEFVKFYLVKHISLFTFMVLSLHICLERSYAMKIKLLCVFIIYLFIFKSHMQLDLL